MTQPAPPTPQLLGDIKVVEFAQNIAIPQCGRILAGMGANVIKVEPPGGDAMRGSARDGAAHEAPGYAVINPDKRSMALDLQSADSRPVIDALFVWADVVLVAFKQSDLARYGIDWDSARAVNPRLIHVTHTPFGPNGEYADEGGYDVLAQGLSGMGFTMNRSEDGLPLPTRPAVNDCGTGITAALGVVAALRHRDKTGIGQRVDVSLLATAVNLAVPTISHFTATSPTSEYSESEEALLDRRNHGAGFDQLRNQYETHMMQGQRNFRLYFRYYATSDGLIAVAGLSRGLRAKFHEATGITKPAGAADLASSEFQAVVTEAEALFRTHTTDEWMTQLRAVGYPCGRFNLPFEALNDPQVRANWFVHDFEHPTMGHFTTPGMPVQFSETPVGFRKPSPAFAVHTTQVLREIGFDEATITTLVETNIVVANNESSNDESPTNE